MSQKTLWAESLLASCCTGRAPSATFAKGGHQAPQGPRQRVEANQLGGTTAPGLEGVEKILNAGGRTARAMLEWPANAPTRFAYGPLCKCACITTIAGEARQPLLARERQL